MMDSVDSPPLRVLLAEDDADLAAGLAAWLRRHGHRVRVTADGPAALRAAAAEPPDVLLLDLSLPGMDGLQVAEHVQRELVPAGPKAPLVIAVTGRDGAEDRRRSREAGIDLHLTKPLDEGLLLRLLRRFHGIIG